MKLQDLDPARVTVVSGQREKTCIQFFVHGIPQPKGSMNSFINPRTNKIVSVFGSKESRPKLACWAACIKAEASVAVTKIGWLPLDAPIELEAVFVLPRPKGHYGRHGLKPTAPKWQTKKPDLDKLLRTLLDALTGIVFNDDAQVSSVTATKEYNDEIPGVRVAVRKLEDRR